ncbi:hypothetical protein [Litorilituus sediminis]|uniref:Uncharacterized protein n=1 Tax=Litorilituus sediminis TaxID=718192 RepID=A0A4P6P3E3_9GAMM|nr:hypothetical protein [Litorilituus sediminis]QBG35833.1 hypothetical protein EMK97_08955 [Litorilituus sediminis]
MNQVVQVLTQLANNATLVTKEEVAHFLTNSELSTQQKTAIAAHNINTLVETVHDLPVIKCVPIIVSDDDEEQIITISNKHVANAS